MIPVNEPLLGENEKKYLIECLDSGWLSSEGPFVSQFQEQFASRVCRKYGIAVCNGSVALDIAVSTLEIGPGDEVIMPSFTIISSAAAVIRSGAVPVLVDSDPVTWNMDVSQIEERITARTKAIMVVHTYGLPVDMDPVLELAQRYGLKVIEDAAQAHGLEYKGRPCGSLGDISTFSFYPNKLVTTGEGGMVLVDNADLARRCHSLHNLCFQPQKRFFHEELGWNFRMSNFQAAVGLAQLEQLDEFVIRKRHMGQRYRELLSGILGLQIPLQKTSYAENIYWVFGLVLDNRIAFDSEEAMRRLADRQIGTRPFFWPMHEQPVFKKMGLFRDTRLPVSETLARRGFYLPSGLAISNEQIEEVSHAVREILIGAGC
jgi:perosamine synthetase